MLRMLCILVGEDRFVVRRDMEFDTLIKRKPKVTTMDTYYRTNGTQNCGLSEDGLVF